MVTDSSIGTYEYYVPIAKVTIDGTTKYYAMPTPGTLSNPSAKLPAIEVIPDGDGNFLIGANREFIFSVYDSGKRLGDGTVLYNIRIGGDYSTKMGALSLNGSTGNIAYDNSYYAGEFAANIVVNSDGSVSIDSAYEGGRLGFAYTEADGKRPTTPCICIKLMSRRPPNSMSISAAISARLMTARPSA